MASLKSYEINRLYNKLAGGGRSKFVEMKLIAKICLSPLVHSERPFCAARRLECTRRHADNQLDISRYQRWWPRLALTTLLTLS